VINADDPFRAEWLARARTEFVATFGLSTDADCRVLGEPELTPSQTMFTLRLPDDEKVEVVLPLLGVKNVVNALAAAAAAHAVGASAEDVRIGLERAEAVRGRLNALAGLEGSTVIDDSYNANPSSVRAALDYLSRLLGTRILVLGDMAELGAESVELHREIGAYAQSRCDVLFSIGELARHAATAYGAGAQSFTDLSKLEAALKRELAVDVTVLVKGSRVMGLERLVRALVPPSTKGGASC
jgi:UDP-N-acetylmuramoyl-tripeptide--D-alanyl-D-alanine ligase